MKMVEEVKHVVVSSSSSSTSSSSGEENVVEVVVEDPELERVNNGEDLVVSEDMVIVQVEQEMMNCKSETEKKEVSCVIDVESSSSSGVLNFSGKASVCRICHLNNADSSGSDQTPSDLIQLGCGCKSDLGAAHRNCAEAWFQYKRDRYCEICGEVAKNVKGVEDTKFMEEWNEGRMRENGPIVSDGSGRFCQGQPYCNFLMACLIVAFILPWLFRANLFP